MVVIDKEKKTIRTGIIDYIQQYNFEKILESNFKRKIYLGSEPTIIPTVGYRRRFVEAMDKYFIALYHDTEIESFDDILKLSEKAQKSEA